MARTEPSKLRSVGGVLLATALRGDIPVDWSEVTRVASMPAYGCAEEVAAMKQEVEASLAQTAK
jgi:hypothetical protein